MAQSRLLGLFWQRFLVVSVLALPFEVATISLVAGKQPAAAAADPSADPTGVPALLELEQKVKKVVDAVMPATVALRMTPGSTQGSGVIVNPEGLILTAAHVIGRPGRNCRVTLSDGRRVTGVTLGADMESDAGMIQILDPGPWPYVEVGERDLDHGEWCLALGHPGGYERDRPAVPRLGRLLRERSRWGFLRSDCQIIRGDSGGPLFDVEGQLIGIHSRLETRFTANYHVPMTAFRDQWDDLTAPATYLVEKSTDPPRLGVTVTASEQGCLVTEVTEDSAAALAGLRADDVILRMDGKATADADRLRQLLGQRKAGDEVSLDLLRDQKIVKVKARLGRRQSP